MTRYHLGAAALALLLIVSASVMAHGAIHLHTAIEDGRERGRMVGGLAVDVAVMKARADVALDR